MIRNSLVSFSEQMMSMQNNALQVLASMNQATSSTADNITVQVTDVNGATKTISIPTIGFLKSEIDRLNQNLITLSSIDARGAIVQPASNIFQKIISVDLNRDPNTLGSLGTINNFISEKNWFFDALLNPALKVSIDLSGKIEDNVREVLSRRYILDFENDGNGSYTARGNQAIALWNETFKNRADITITELENWIRNTPGVDLTSLTNYDEEKFSLDPNQIQYDGLFTILGVSEDKINKKLWYLIDTLDYYEIATGAKQTLKLNDELIINKAQTSTRYKVIEINKSASQIQVRLELVEGLEPIPVGINGGMKFYSPYITVKSVDISIGFDEYNVLFLKPINTDNNLIARNWSPGTAYYTNDLILNSTDGTGNNGKSMTEFYLQNVANYGEILKDSVNRFIPRHLGLVPNAPVLSESNYRVIQINKHATDTPDLDKNRKNHALVNTLKSNIDELNKTITEKRKELFGKTFRRVQDRANLEAQINKFVQDKESKSKLLASTVADIVAQNQAQASVVAEFAAQLFWNIPTPVENGKTRPQEVVKFEVQYKKTSKSGGESPNDTFKVVDPNGNTTSAVFSAWKSIVTGIRRRVYDVSLQAYIWEAEDLSNIDIPNINSIQIPITPNERIEIRVRSISEVGLGDAEITSEWSNVLQISFPDELVRARNPEELIVKNAELESVRTSILDELNGRTLDQHLSDFIIVENQYYPHNMDNIAYKDATGKIISGTAKIKQLEAAENVEAVQDLVLNEPWENFSNGHVTAQFYKNQSRVYLQGLIRVVLNDDDLDANDQYPTQDIRTTRNPINTSWSQIGQLPVGYRPASKIVFDVITMADPSEPNEVSMGRIDISPSGAIMLLEGESGYVNLSNIHFRI